MDRLFASLHHHRLSERLHVPQRERDLLALEVRAAAVVSASEAEWVRRLRAGVVVVMPRFAEGSTDVVAGYRAALKGQDQLRFYGGGQLCRDLTLPRVRELWPAPSFEQNWPPPLPCRRAVWMMSFILPPLVGQSLPENSSAPKMEFTTPRTRPVIPRMSPAVAVRGVGWGLRRTTTAKTTAMTARPMPRKANKTAPGTATIPQTIEATPRPYCSPQALP